MIDLDCVKALCCHTSCMQHNNMSNIHIYVYTNDIRYIYQSILKYTSTRTVRRRIRCQSYSVEALAELEGLNLKRISNNKSITFVRGQRTSCYIHIFILYSCYAFGIPQNILYFAISATRTSHVCKTNIAEGSYEDYIAIILRISNV